MPTYEYACRGCGHEFEREQRITDDPLKKCPKCGKMKIRRLVGSGNFILKGGGWYADSYSSASNRPSTKSSESSNDSSTTPDKQKSDTKSQADKPKTDKPKTGKSKPG